VELDDEGRAHVHRALLAWSGQAAPAQPFPQDARALLQALDSARAAGA
jgi:hypothetical protein